jgi:cation diffusion facilitator family transporter
MCRVPPPPDPAPTPERPSCSPRRSDVTEQRYQAVNRILMQVLVLNLLVAVAKIVFGYVAGIVSILSDGFHSLTDGFSNVAALVGVYLARKPPDRDHPYGHRKFETMSAGAIAALLFLVIVEITQAAWVRLRHGSVPRITTASFALMIGTMLVNVIVTWYEHREGQRLSSEVLLADAMHTRSDVLTSLTVIAALAGSALGYPILDPIAALVVVLFIAYAGWEIAVSTSNVLGDRVVIAEDQLRRIVLGVPGVLGCHQIRTRGSADHVFLDPHIWMRRDMPLQEAHAKSHVVKDLLMQRFPQIADAVIHIEPPPADRDEAPA